MRLMMIPNYASRTLISCAVIVRTNRRVADIAKLDKVSQPDLPYPYWHQSFTASDRLGPADLSLHAPYLQK